MKLNMLVAVVLLAMAGLAVPARAQQAEVAVTVPFEFVVGTAVLPAGTYTVSRTASLDVSPLLFASRDHGAYVLPSAFDNTRAGDVSLRFDQIGGAHVLSEIRTLGGTYTIDNRREAQKLTKLAQSDDHTRANGMSSSGAQ